jgi:hypothetical protein
MFVEIKEDESIAARIRKIISKIELPKEAVEIIEILLDLRSKNYI